MSAYPAREKRQPVKIGAWLKSGRGWRNVVLAFLSARFAHDAMARPAAEMSRALAEGATR